MAYTVNDGTLGVYDESVRLWRIKVEDLFILKRTDQEVAFLYYFQSKTRGTALTSFDLLGTGTYQLIIGWESGKVIDFLSALLILLLWNTKEIFQIILSLLLNKVDVRDVTTGENLFKLNFNQVITSVAHADYRGKGSNDLILCTKNGEGKLKCLTTFKSKALIKISFSTWL